MATKLSKAYSLLSFEATFFKGIEPEIVARTSLVFNARTSKEELSKFAASILEFLEEVEKHQRFVDGN